MRPAHFSAILLILIVFFLTACNKGKKETATPQKNKVLPVQVMVAHPGPLNNILSVTGSLMAGEMVELHPEVSGRIQNIAFREGSSVAKGQLLVKLQDKDLQAQMLKLQSQENLALADEQRKQKMLEIKGISQEEYEQSKNQLNAVRADMALLAAQIEKTEIRAPFHGTIGLRQVSEGSYVSPSTAIATLQQTDPLKLEFSVPGKYAAQLKPGNPVRFRAEGQTASREARIYATESFIDPGTRTLKVRALCANPGHTLQPGSFARVEVVLEQRDSTVLLPTHALIPYLKGYRVFTCLDGIAKARDVGTGMRTDSAVEIISGLRAGDTIILSGLLQLKEGMAVKAMTAPQGKKTSK